MEPIVECKVNDSLRKRLGYSHAAAVTIALLLMFSGIDLVVAIREPAVRIAGFLGTAVAILDVPYIPRSLDPLTRMKLFVSALEFAEALMGFGAAWALSRWIYGVGPLRCLRAYGRKIRRTVHVRSS